MNKKQIVVTAAIIRNDEDKFLITQRLKNKPNALRWEFPGGKVEFGEDLRDCIKREIKEELDIEIKPKEIYEYSSFNYDAEKQIILLGFCCEFVSGNILKKEISDFKWVSPEEMKNYDFTEADLVFVEKLSKKINSNKKLIEN